jgi:hypothetical protein
VHRVVSSNAQYLYTQLQLNGRATRKELIIELSCKTKKKYEHRSLAEIESESKERKKIHTKIVYGSVNPNVHQSLDFFLPLCA